MNLILISAVMLALSVVIDRIFGDPHTPFHPVALLGRFIGWWGVPSRWSVRIQRTAGVAMWFVTVILYAAPFFLFGALAPWYLLLTIGPFLLKTCFAWRSLEDHMDAVSAALNRDTESGRLQVGLLVSRNTQDFDREQILSAGYESISENIVDSIVSPVFYFGLFGLGGAAVYRAANTMDAMLGYRDEREFLGWWPARMDDILNFIPARITGLLLLVYFALNGRFAPAYEALISDAGKRPGYNGGIPIAVMAGGVGVRFEKLGIYSIGTPERSIQEAGGDIIRAVRAVALMFSVIVIAALLLLVLLGNI